AVTTRFVQPRPGATAPSAPTADSRARTTVVPTATTRPPQPRTALMTPAVVSGTSNRSAYGGSSCSADDTPVCSVTGAIRTPRATSSATSSPVNGLPALGISALP